MVIWSSVFILIMTLSPLTTVIMYGLKADPDKAITIDKRLEGDYDYSMYNLLMNNDNTKTWLQDVDDIYNNSPKSINVKNIKMIKYNVTDEFWLTDGFLANYDLFQWDESDFGELIKKTSIYKYLSDIKDIPIESNSWFEAYKNNNGPFETDYNSYVEKKLYGLKDVISAINGYHSEMTDINKLLLKYFVEIMSKYNYVSALTQEYHVSGLRPDDSKKLNYLYNKNVGSEFNAYRLYEKLLTTMLLNIYESQKRIANYDQYVEQKKEDMNQSWKHLINFMYSYYYLSRTIFYNKNSITHMSLNSNMPYPIAYSSYFHLDYKNGDIQAEHESYNFVWLNILMSTVNIIILLSGLVVINLKLGIIERKIKYASN